MLTRLVLLALLAGQVEARPRMEPTTQPLACPDDADTCELTITGTLTYAKRSRWAKWDDLRIRAVVDGKRTLVYASINIPHRTKLKLKPGTRYRFTIAADKPFGAGNLWVIDAKPR